MRLTWIIAPILALGVALSATTARADGGKYLGPVIVGAAVGAVVGAIVLGKNKKKKHKHGHYGHGHGHGHKHVHRGHRHGHKYGHRHHGRKHAHRGHRRGHKHAHKGYGHRHKHGYRGRHRHGGYGLHKHKRNGVIVVIRDQHRRDQHYRDYDDAYRYDVREGRGGRAVYVDERRRGDGRGRDRGTRKRGRDYFAAGYRD